MNTENPTNETRPVAWDDEAILKALGWTPAPIRKALTLHRQAKPGEPSDWAIYQWTSRKKIAAEWRPRLLYCALRMDRMTLQEALRVEKPASVVADAS
ncbi:MAG: hypothetical protein J0I48_19080 [Devosia sp.]|uniref:hypothetical protein n=1 Tax=Devosia sp. 66-22 TaxID=1895753 RepID=UPI0009282A9A|nr:hypothetical protein [Devosia sp. 66-22]MBN9348270.1 hypothetical protein [Devosia sp.]OJX48989.1 MAG: hypothetical protein BGO81_10365 [Devosia sp. 66-22]